jgi:2-polyprenyl-3-methyl-5-hydroxy-6-metoxy-1,4-benzoquinol methylase
VTSPSPSGSSALESLRPLLRAKGGKYSLEEFHERVNVVFHDYESTEYDALHQAMWESLPEQFGLLTDDLLAEAGELSALRVLDVGCGTGLSSELLLGTRLGGRIQKIDLLDTSSGMLEACGRRSASWKVDHELIEGTVDDVSGRRYDLVLTCSVLHHIPDHESFIKAISAVLEPGGVFMHLQDPNGDAQSSSVLSARVRRLRNFSLVTRAIAKLSRIVRSRVQAGDETYIEDINRRLLAEGVIVTPLTPGELWSITDIHVNDLPYSSGEGVSLGTLKRVLRDYQLISARTYGHFGQLRSDLPQRFRTIEDELNDRKAASGFFLGAIWRKLTAT